MKWYTIFLIGCWLVGVGTAIATFIVLKQTLNARNRYGSVWYSLFTLAIATIVCPVLACFIHYDKLSQAARILRKVLLPQLLLLALFGIWVWAAVLYFGFGAFSWRELRDNSAKLGNITDVAVSTIGGLFALIAVVNGWFYYKRALNYVEPTDAQPSSEHGDSNETAQIEQE